MKYIVTRKKLINAEALSSLGLKFAIDTPVNGVNFASEGQLRIAGWALYQNFVEIVVEKNNHQKLYKFNKQRPDVIEVMLERNNLFEGNLTCGFDIRVDIDLKDQLRVGFLCNGNIIWVQSFDVY